MEGRKDDIEINESCDKLIAITYQNHPAPFSVYSTTTIFPRRVSPLLMRKAYMHTHTHTHFTRLLTADAVAVACIHDICEFVIVFHLDLEFFFVVLAAVPSSSR